MEGEGDLESSMIPRGPLEPIAEFVPGGFLLARPCLPPANCLFSHVAALHPRSQAKQLDAVRDPQEAKMVSRLSEFCQRLCVASARAGIAQSGYAALGDLLPGCVRLRPDVLVALTRAFRACRSRAPPGINGRRGRGQAPSGLLGTSLTGENGRWCENRSNYSLENLSSAVLDLFGIPFVTCQNHRHDANVGGEMNTQ